NTGQDSIVTGVAATSADSAWAIGYTDTNQPGSLNALLLRWDGAAWKIVPDPAPARTFLGGVAASGGTAWTVGTASAVSCRSAACGQPVILRWSGATWA